MTNWGFFELARGQRACRDYTDAAVPEPDIAAMLDAATRAPSAHNCQPWEFVVVRAATTRHQIAEIARETWHGAESESRARLDSQMLSDVDQFIRRQDFGGAPVLVVLCVDRTAVHKAMIGCSIYPAAQNLMLGAASLGYGTIFTNFTFNQHAAMSDMLGLPDHIQTAGVIAIGRPAMQLGPGRRVPFAVKTHCEHFGMPWPGTPQNVAPNAKT